MSKIKQLGKDISIYGLGIALAKMINFILVPIYVRAFSIEEYGTLNLYTTIGMFVSVIFSFQIALGGMLRFYYDKEDIEYKKKIVSTGLFFLIGISIILVGSSFLITENLLTCFLKEATNITTFRLMIINNAWLIIFFYLQVLLRVQRKPKLFSIFTASQIIISTIMIMFFLFYLKLGINSVFLGNISGLTIMIAILYYRNRNFFAFAFDTSLLKKMFFYGFILMLSTLGLTLNSDLNRFFLLKFKTLDDIAFISLAVKLSGFITIIITAFSQAWKPFVYSIMNNNEAKETYSKVLDYFSLLFFFVITISALAPEIIMIVSTKEYLDARNLVPFQVFAVVLANFVQLIDIGLHIKKKPHYITYGSYLGLLINTGLLYFMLRYSYSGLVIVPISYFIGIIIQIMFVYHFSQKFYPIKYKKNHLIIILFFTTALVSLFSFYNLSIFLRIGLILLSFIFFFFIQKDICLEVLLKMKKKIRRS